MNCRTGILWAALALGGTAQAAVCGKGTISAMRMPSGTASVLHLVTTEMPQAGWAYASGAGVATALEFRYGGDMLRWLDRIRLLTAAFAQRSRVTLNSTGVYCTGTVDEWQIEIDDE